MSLRAWVAAVAVGIVVFAAGEGRAPAADTLYGSPAYDSGWRELATGFNQFSHGIGSAVDDYVVDLSFRDLGESPSVHQEGFGGDSAATATGNVSTGAFLWSLSTTSASVYRNADDTTSHQARLRIWVVPAPDYDSGWVAVAAGTEVTLYHSLGGSSDDLVVDLTFKGGTPTRVHKGGYGADYYFDAGGRQAGGYWHSLTASSVKVRRGIDSTLVEQMRVRVFRRPDPDYDSGWQPATAGVYLRLQHALGGPWNDFVVDLQLKNTTAGGIGVTQRGYGGDWIPISSTSSQDAGTHWYDLTGSGISVLRHPFDIFADQVRVRIWQDRAPKYDSSWAPLSIGDTTGFAHDLGGDPDMLVVDLAFHEFQGWWVNSLSYGGDAFAGVAFGAQWLGLSDTAVYVNRLVDDRSAASGRVRLWQAPMADYDSGWRVISPGETLSLTHSLGGSVSDLVVDLQGRSPSLGRHQMSYGVDFYNEGLDVLRARGMCWKDLTTSTVEVERREEDTQAEEVRLRIWRNTAFDYTTAWVYVAPGESTWTHGLDVPADDLVVDMQMHSDSPFYGRNQLRLGGDQFWVGGHHEYHGAWWARLTSTRLAVYRAADDLHANQVRVRVWTAPSGRPYYDLAVSRAGAGSGTVMSHPGGILCGSDCSETYVEDTAVTLHTVPHAGSVFTAFSGDPDCSDGVVTMLADRSCTATFGVDGSVLFADGFESGDTNEWSSVVP